MAARAPAPQSDVDMATASLAGVQLSPAAAASSAQRNSAADLTTKEQLVVAYEAQIAEMQAKFFSMEAKLQAKDEELAAVGSQLNRAKSNKESYEALAKQTTMMNLGIKEAVAELAKRIPDIVDKQDATNATAAGEGETNVYPPITELIVLTEFCKLKGLDALKKAVGLNKPENWAVVIAKLKEAREKARLWYRQYSDKTI
eukprot:tig00021572_g22399.t1